MKKSDRKIIVYIDMDDTICDYKGGFDKCRLDNPNFTFPQSRQSFFFDLKPISGAIETFGWLNNQPELDIYILTAPSIENPYCYTDKRLWIGKHLGFAAANQLIISPHKNLKKGHFLIDVNVSGKGQENFEGEVIHYGSSLYPDWPAVHQYFKTKINNGDFLNFQESTHQDILCFRAFDLRDRFSEPVATFRKVLELLQSERAYLPEMSSNIICYLKSGQSIPIPELFYLEERLQFELRADAEEWVRQRKTTTEEDQGRFRSLFGLVIADPSLPLEEQIELAANYKNTEVIEPSENDHVCRELTSWLNSAIEGLPELKTKRQKTIDTLALQDHEELVKFFKDKVADQTNPKRWVILSRDYGLTAISGNAYFDLVNHYWTAEISEASCIKDKKVAEAVIASFGADVLVEVVTHFISQKELAKTAIKMQSDPKVIMHHSETDIYLYEENNQFSDASSQAVITLRNPEQYLIDRNVVGVEHLMVSIPNEAMDAVSIAWCQHRDLQGALGGPVGNEYGGPDCDYD